VDMILDGGELPGTPSTVVDLSDYEDGGSFRILRQGAVPSTEIESALT
jgi:L-threonylcarbamoyladenylate synthase